QFFSLTEKNGSVQENILAAEGQDATLPCKAPKNKTKNISIVLWTKPDLGEDNYVLLYRNGKVNPDKHHFFKNRVDLKDRTINDGDVSLILKNVTFKDSGTYQCFIDQIEQNKQQLFIILYLTLFLSAGDPEGQEGDGGHVGLIVGLTVAALVVVGAIFGVVMFLRHQKKKNSPPPVHSETH
uniref:Ig-like domain-containing protein n=1 Tax=Salarias fasciatus TaxID=181472 RepID=A0A672FPB2_SALFA